MWLVSDDLGGEDAGCEGPGLVWLHMVCGCEAGWMLWRGGRGKAEGAKGRAGSETSGESVGK